MAGIGCAPGRTGWASGVRATCLEYERGERGREDLERVVGDGTVDFVRVGERGDEEMMMDDGVELFVHNTGGDGNREGVEST
jgi:hypothetical protein